jgi:hypothetical protein
MMRQAIRSSSTADLVGCCHSASRELTAHSAANIAPARLSSRYPAIATIVYGRPGEKRSSRPGRDRLKEIRRKLNLAFAPVVALKPWSARHLRELENLPHK